MTRNVKFLPGVIGSVYLNFHYSELDVPAWTEVKRPQESMVIEIKLIEKIRLKYAVYKTRI